jgi:hypothetical protein
MGSSALQMYEVRLFVDVHGSHPTMQRIIVLTPHSQTPDYLREMCLEAIIDVIQRTAEEAHRIASGVSTLRDRATADRGGSNADAP